MNNYFILDSLNLLFLIALVIVTLCVMWWQGFNYCNNFKENVKYYSIFFLFFLSMVGALLSNHLGLTWVFIEATTLTSAYLIMLHKSKNSLEATWKYVFLCSIGISLAFVGIILLLIGSENVNSLFFNDLYANAQAINPFWLKLSFIFILIGFGTKAGLAPVHSWLPDAHAEAPSPVSAMLSATLLNSAVLVILRLVKLMSLAGLGSTVQTLMLTMGLLSIFVTAVYVYKIRNYKRMLAYSSVENMGIISIGIALGSLGTIGAMLHVICHSLIKSSLFLTSGNILTLFKSKEVNDVKDLINKHKCTAWLWMLGAMLILAIPPSPLFLSEFLIIKQFLINHQYVLCTIFVVLLTFIIYGLMSAVLKMNYSKNNTETEPTKLSANKYIPQIILITTAIILGIYMPNILFILIQNAGNIIW